MTNPQPPLRSALGVSAIECSPGPLCDRTEGTAVATHPLGNPRQDSVDSTLSGVVASALQWISGSVLGPAFLAAGLGAVRVGSRGRRRSVRADRAEQARRLPGDDLIPEPLDTLTHAISIACPSQAVWPWLVQMGAGSRAGWYSYDTLDNGRRSSATRLVPELQEIAVGTLFPALPGVTDAFTVLAVEPYRSLVLGWAPNGLPPRVTWAFVPEDRGGTTRLIVRVRAARGYSLCGLPTWVSSPLIRLVHFVMQREQLLGIARRAESWTGWTPDTPIQASR